jgi:hypothetical protein
MKKTLTLLALTILLPTVASAGELYGKITAGGASVGEGVDVAAKCGAKAYPAVKTDKTGSFHLVVAEAGKCTLTITQKGQSAEVSVVSYDAGAQADIVLETKDGKLTARRK